MMYISCPQKHIIRLLLCHNTLLVADTARWKCNIWNLHIQIHPYANFDGYTMYGYEVTSQNVKCGSGEFSTGHAHFFAFRAIFRIAISQKLLQLWCSNFELKLFPHNVNCLRNIKKFEEVGCQISFFVLKWHGITQELDCVLPHNLLELDLVAQLVTGLANQRLQVQFHCSQAIFQLVKILTVHQQKLTH